MKKNPVNLFFVILLLLVLQSCTQSWTKAIRKGKIKDGSFLETIRTEKINGLIVAPVKINGEQYRFLFDTGATLSISEELQDKFDFKTISRGNVIDSDNHRTKVKYVQMDTLFIGETPFIEQTAFVTNLDKNPIIACMGIDGIIGSNLMRYCNWTIDYKNNKITLFKDTTNQVSQTAYQMPFRMDNQFSQLVQFKFGRATLKNVKIDYGSNGPITLTDKGFKVLKDNDIVEKTFKVKGYSQSGISGKVTQINGELALADTLKSGNLNIPEVEIKTGKSGLVGTEVLSRFLLTIDFNTKQIFLEPVDENQPDYSTFGFSVGYSNERQMYIMQVVENSPAAELGITPGMQILKIDSLNFSQNSTLCDYIQYNLVPKKEITMELLGESGENKIVKLKKRRLY